MTSNFDVNTTKINEGFEEAAKVLDHYALARWIIPCQECGEWLTSLGLCVQCGIRYEVVRVSSEGGRTPRALDLGYCTCEKYCVGIYEDLCGVCSKLPRPSQ